MSLYERLQSASTEDNGYDFSSFKAKFEALSDKLRPQVYTLGFLK